MTSEPFPTSLIPMLTLDEVLKNNLERYTSPSEYGPELFSTHREIAIARLALNNQAEAYHKAMTALQLVLDRAIQAADERSVANIFIAIEAIEKKSQSLIDSVQKVTSLLGQIVEIDVDKASILALVSQIPSLVKDTISIVSEDETLADRISGRLNERLMHVMQTCKWNQPEQQEAKPSGAVINIDTFHQLLTSVPNAHPSAPSLMPAPGNRQ